MRYPLRPTEANSNISCTQADKRTQVYLHPLGLPKTYRAGTHIMQFSELSLCNTSASTLDITDVALLADWGDA